MVSWCTILIRLIGVFISATWAAMLAFINTFTSNANSMFWQHRWRRWSWSVVAILHKNFSHLVFILFIQVTANMNCWKFSGKKKKKKKKKITVTNAYIMGQVRHLPLKFRYLTFRVPITTAADYILKRFLFFQRKCQNSMWIICQEILSDLFFFGMSPTTKVLGALKVNSLIYLFRYWFYIGKTKLINLPCFTYLLQVN